jgi:hypothetical protein
LNCRAILPGGWPWRIVEQSKIGLERSTMKANPATYCYLCGARLLHPVDLEDHGYGLCVLNDRRANYFLLAIVGGIIVVGLVVVWKMWN